MADTLNLQFALAMVRSWPDRQEFEAILRQSEASTDQALEAAVSLATMLIGLIAHAEGSSKTEALDKLDSIFADRAERGLE